MVRRQKVLADFGEFALGSQSLDEVLTEACRLIAQALDCHLAKVMEIEQDEQRLLVRAGVGWPDGVVGHARLPMGERSSETYSVELGEPVLTPDIHQEDRFDFPAFMVDAGVVGIINVPIFLPGRQPYGLLQVDSREPWEPDEESIAFLRTYATILGPVIDRLHKVHALRDATDRNETLLRELQHRIKNNIGAIRGLIHLRERRAQTDDARAELSIVGERVEALRLVHEQVYATGSEDRLSLRDYATQLLEGLVDVHRERGVRLMLDLPDVAITSDTAIPLGLILNEFTTNSLKHAFVGADEPIISAKAEECDGSLILQIRDNGRGLPSQSEPASPGSGTGMKLIQGLSRQIGATPSWTSDAGAVLRLEIRNLQH